MLATDLLVQPATGFIAVSPGRATAPPHTEPTPFVALAPALAPDAETAHWATHITERPTWHSSVGSNARKVEFVIVAGICGYFAFGLGGALGLY